MGKFHGKYRKRRGLPSVKFGIWGIVITGSAIVALDIKFGVTLKELKSYRANGACAVIAGRLVDQAGNPVVDAASDRVVGIELDSLRAIPFRLVVAAGRKKADAVQAALIGKYATHLVIDEQLAQAIIDGDASPPGESPVDSRHAP